MTLEQQYAQALYELVSKNPARSSEYLTGLTQTLSRKGHQKLMPRIYSQYCSILERGERSKKYAAITPESERTRILVELYRTLVATE